MIISETTYKKMPERLKRMFDELPNPGKDEVVGLFPVTASSGRIGESGCGEKLSIFGQSRSVRGPTYWDQGSAARFFYCAKASRAERNSGLEGMPQQEVPYSEYRDNYKDTRDFVTHYPDGTPRPVNPTRNNHPTVKPLALMEYLCRLTRTPTGGVILDPFAGSGTTLAAAHREGRRAIGIEIDEGYCEIAARRMPKQMVLKL